MATTDLPEKILGILAEKDIDTLSISDMLKLEHQRVIGAVKSLEAFGDLIITCPHSTISWELTDEGVSVAQNGSYEVQVFNAISLDGIPYKELMETVPNCKIGFSKAMSKHWLIYDKMDGIVKRRQPFVADDVKRDLQLIRQKLFQEVPDDCKQDYKKRKLIQEMVTKSFLLKKGLNFSTILPKLETELTPEMINTGSWKTVKFKPYNFEACGLLSQGGNLHPLLKVKSEFRQIFLEMGFSEMPTNNYVENSFWNFDALFQPQQHPARDCHDTFFLKEPQFSNDFPQEYLEKVQNIHSKGGYGSLGYRYNWSITEAMKNILRTHTTAVSARMLYKLAKQPVFKPVKYYSIDRVFRNETLDATHLAEFNQVEGVVADYDLSLGDLLGILKEFFNKLGISQLKFKPAYNPYTEPSMEIFCFHKGLGKWIEVGNSGMFRPEMLLPMGLPKKVNVIAWGLSLERPTMIKYGINNIRDLVGPKINLNMVYHSPICRLDN